MRNPPAFDRILIEHYEALERTVDPQWLPLPVLVASQAARDVKRLHQHMAQAGRWAEHLRSQGNYLEADTYIADTTRCTEASLRKLMKQKQWRQGFTEYGSGNYGTIYPTQKKGIVCKITTDASEAKTVANLLTWDKQPYGIVKYYAVFRFPARSHKNRPVFILWRDEVQPIELSTARDARGSQMAASLHTSKNIAHQARVWVQAALRRSPQRAWADIAWARDNKPDDCSFDPEHDDEYVWLKRLGKLPFRRRMAYVLYALRICWRDLMSFSYGFHPGHALYECLENDMLLADVHANNVMKAQDGSWDVSDPGHMIELSNRYAHVRIPTL